MAHHRATFLRRALLLLVIVLASGCGGPQIDLAQVAEDAWEFDDSEGTLAQFREAFPDSVAKLETRQGSVHGGFTRPDFVWSVEAELAGGHRLRISRPIRRDEIGADGTLVQASNVWFHRELYFSSGSRYDLNPEDYQRIVATRGEADALQAAGISLDMAPLNDAVLRLGLASVDPPLHRLCAAFPDAKVTFDFKDVFTLSREGYVKVSLRLGTAEGADEPPFHIEAFRPCLIAFDRRSAEATGERPAIAATLTCKKKWSTSDGRGTETSEHEVHHCHLTEAQLCQSAG
jgi:hypothetical protein